MGEKDVLVNAVYEGGTLCLYGRKGMFELDWPDSFWLTSEDAGRLPGDWLEHASEPDRGFVQVRWPEPVRRNGSRSGRLKYFYEHLFQPLGIRPLEADVDPVQRFLIEHPKVQLVRDWRLLWYDLETELVRDWDKPWESPILSFSWKSSDGSSGHVRARSKDRDGQQEVLREFAKLADRHDVILAWAGSRFDDRVIRGAMAYLDVAFDPELYHWLDHLWLFKRYFQRSEDGGVTQSYALESISFALLGEEKKVPLRDLAIQLGMTGSDVFTWVWQNAPDLLREYNDQDVELMAKLEDKTNFIKLHLSVCALCRNLPNKRSQYPMAQVDGRMLQRGHAVGYHFPSRIHLDQDDNRPQQARGAFVPEAVRGLHESVAVLDYSRMYPSIIRSFNMSPETLDPRGQLEVPETTPHGNPTGGTIARFRAEPEGNLPAALRGVLLERKQYEERMDSAEVGSDDWYDAQRLSQACKILANTFYGVILSPFSRFYVQDIGESVTSMGRFLLSRTIQCAARRGHPLVFGDTDSIAVVADDEEAHGIEREMNEEVLPELLAACGVTNHWMELGYEKRFSRIVVTASKKYAGKFARYKGRPADPDAPFDVRGMEIVRSDVCVAARRLQKAAIGHALDGWDAARMWRWVGEAKEHFLTPGAVDREHIVLQKTLKKRPEEYASEPIHLKVALAMAEKGIAVFVGTKIPFLVTRTGAVYPDDVGDQDLDLGLIWNQYVWAPTSRVLEAAYPDHNWESFEVPRGHDPNQLVLFDGGTPRMKSDKQRDKRDAAGPTPRPMKRQAMDEKPTRKLRKTKQKRKVRKTKARGGRTTLVLQVEDNFERARQLREVLEEYPGKHPVVVEVADRGAKEVSEIDVPQRVESPEGHPKLAYALRQLGVRWDLKLLAREG